MSAATAAAHRLVRGGIRGAGDVGVVRLCWRSHDARTPSKGTGGALAGERRQRDRLSCRREPLLRASRARVKLRLQLQICPNARLVLYLLQDLSAPPDREARKAEPLSGLLGDAGHRRSLAQAPQRTHDRSDVILLI
jgi:hypothetical protein